MPQVDLIDDTNSTYYYFGWVDDGDGWQINRQTRINALIERANSINNIAIPDLATAWPSRSGLTYS
jgi:rhamnogalacturonyl hydrolase YesR